MSERYRATVDPAASNNPHSAAVRFVGLAPRVLEVGCSVGHVTEQLVAAGNRVVGVEIDAHAAAEAEQWAERVHVLDLDRTPLTEVEDGEFDVVVLGDVLEHLRDPAATLRDVATLLTDDGRLVVSVPNVSFVDVRLMLLDGRWEYQDDGLLDRTHLRWFTAASLRELLASAGFVARSLERVVHGPGVTDLGVDPDRFPPELLAYVLADPEATTYQFVVEATRGGHPDALDLPAPALPDLAAQHRELRDELERLHGEVWGLREHNRALVTEVEAWRNSTLARVAAPARSLWARFRR